MKPSWLVGWWVKCASGVEGEEVEINWSVGSWWVKCATGMGGREWMRRWGLIGVRLVGEKGEL